MFVTFISVWPLSKFLSIYRDARAYILDLASINIILKFIQYFEGTSPFWNRPKLKMNLPNFSHLVKTAQDCIGLMGLHKLISSSFDVKSEKEKNYISSIRRSQGSFI